MAVAFAPDGTAFIGLKTGVIKSFDYDTGHADQYEPFGQEHVNFTNLDVQVQQLLGPRPHRHHRRPAVRHGRQQLRLRQLHLQPGPAGHPGDRAEVGHGPGSSTTTAPTPAMPSGPPGRHRMPDQHPGLAPPGGQAGQRLDRQRRRAAAARGRLHAVPQPRLRRRASSVPTACSTPRPVTAPASTPRTTGQANNPCPATLPTRAARCAARTSAPPATRSASAARSSGSTRPTATRANGSTSNADRIVAVGQRNPWRLTFRPGHHRAVVRRRRRQHLGGDQPARTCPGSARPVNRGWPCYEGSSPAARRAARLGRAGQAGVREPVRRGRRCRRRRRTSATAPAAVRC